MMTAEELRAGMAHATGTEDLHKHWLGLLYTDGVQFLAEGAGAYWLIDAIASHQPKARKDPMLCEFQLWTLKVKKNKAVLTCERDTNDVAIRQRIPYTDFPLDDVKLYLENGVLMLPSER